MLPSDPPAHAAPPAPSDTTSGAPALEPPGSGAGGQGRGRGPVLVWIALALLVVLGVAVVAVLPRVVDDLRSPARAPAEDAGAEPAEITADEEGGAAARAAARVDAERALEHYLKARARLELARAALWGEPEWTSASARAEEGDRLFGYQRFSGAADEYAAAAELLTALEAGREDRLRGALEAGRAALAHNRAQAAIESFERVLAIAPEHVEAASALARARVRDDVVAHVADGERMERAAELDPARQAYARAVELDGAYAPGADGLARVTTAIADRGFREAMTAALADIEAGRFDSAAAGLDAAARLHADDPAVRDARARLAAARQRVELARLRRDAARRAGVEDWVGAVSVYEKALALAPSTGFAREGIARATERARLNEQVEYYLADVERLYSPEPLAHAERLIESAGTIPADEPRLEAKVEELERRVRSARRPQLVTVRSDGETEVAIYHVARLGRFQERSLELRPGRYTVVGSRPGYRDVRRVIDVRPDASPAPVTIRCEERI